MNAEKVYHLVHIGYDYGEHPGFEEQLKQLISGISQSTNEIISFVDVPEFGIEHPTKARKIIDLDLFISDYFSVLFNVYLFRILWTVVTNDHLSGMLERIPTEIRDFLRDELGDDFPILQTNDLLAGLTERDFEKILQVTNDYPDRRLSLLQKLRKRFIGKSEYIYPKNSSERTFGFFNEGRRQRIQHHAEEALGSSRVHQTFMPDGGFFPETQPPEIKQNDSAYELYSSYLVRSLVRARFQGLLGVHKNAYGKNGWNINPETEHVVVGEYRGLCVNTFANVLVKSLGCRNVRIDEEYTLEKEDLLHNNLLSGEYSFYNT